LRTLDTKLALDRRTDRRTDGINEDEDDDDDGATTLRSALYSTMTRRSDAIFLCTV